ncbi:MAG: ATP-binding protein [Bacteroidota bacterium]
MNKHQLSVLLKDLRSLSAETEWVEFKANNAQELGQYLSALSNSACIHDESYGYLVFGISDKTHQIVGTSFDPNQKAKGNEDLIPWLSRLLNPRVHFDYFTLKQDDKRVVIFRVKATLRSCLN